MTRDLLVQILRSSRGVEGTAPTFVVADNHEAAIYLGELGRSMAVSDIARLILHEGYLEVETRNDSQLFTTYEALQAVATKPGRDRISGRTGFG